MARYSLFLKQMIDVKSTFIPFREAGYFTKLIIDYIEGNSELDKLISHRPNVSSFKKAIEERASIDINRTVLHEALLGQHQGVDISSSTKTNIDIITDSNTFTITTGHQLCLFTGPLYFIYKIVSALNTVKKLKEEYPDNNFVPVFWMASEDHDFEEISVANIYNKKLKWEQGMSGAVGRLDTDSINSVLSELKYIVGDKNLGQEFITAIEKAYTPGSSITIATRELIYTLFPNDGLVVIDGDDKSLKNQFKDVMRDELQNQRIEKAIKSTNELLAKNYKIQVNPRPINLFYLSPGSRERVIDVSENLLDEVESNPENFSPNVIMRCMYQERVLPNLAYIGGGGELSYWLQLKSAFELYDIPFPILLLRNSALFIDKKSSKRFTDMGFNLSQLFQDIHQLTKIYVDQSPSDNSLIEDKIIKLKDSINDLLHEAIGVDSSIESSLKGEEKKILNSLDAIDKRIYKARKRKLEDQIARIENIKSKLFPDNGLQERYENIIPFYLKYGEDFIETLKKEFDPFINEFQILSE
ncbi:MAG: bacillithiol biosynthesis cysteine-adding enzyme BshC [Flavobacteriales bacterium]|nr:bacillithiol biosynthesis cysteine-adding enzyme BshC [Flavobacteriales bacterium]